MQKIYTNINLLI